MPPVQISVLPEMLAITFGYNVISILAEPVHPPAPVTVTAYVPAVETLSTLDVEPVDQRNV